MRKIIVYSVVAVIIAFVIANVYYVRTKDFICDIGGEKVTKQEFLFVLAVIRDSMISGAREANPDLKDDKAFWATKIDGKDAPEVAKDKAMQYIKKLKVQIALAKKNKVTLSQDEIRALEKEFEDDIVSRGGAEVVNGELMQNGTDIGAYKSIYMQEGIARKFADAEKAKFTVTEQDIRDYYDQNLDIFKWPRNEDAVWVRHILIKTVDAQGNELPESVVEKARENAENLLDMVKKGADFGALASKVSEDPGSRSNGGQYLFAKGIMEKPFEEAAFGLKPGEISGLVRTRYGFHIIKCEEFIPAGQPISFEGAKNCFVFQLNEEFLKEELYEKKLEEWKKEYPVNIYKKVYDTIEIS